jgi:N-methylhydantoinase A
LKPVEPPRYRLGIDIGGTFTDFSLLDGETGEVSGFKTPTVPGDPGRGVSAGLDQLRARGTDLSQIEYFVHGTTIALNSVVQRSGARIALLVTAGFRDVLELGRLRLPVPWSFHSRRPAPLVPRELVVSVRERIRFGGAIDVALDPEEIERTVAAVVELEVEGAAICLLHSYANPAHELALRDALARVAPGLSVSCSSEIWPQMREYERTLVTVINAYVRPATARYLDGLERAASSAGIRARPYITRSNGGIMTIDAAREEPVQTLLSGPASGVIAAAEIAARAGFADFVTLDMGGTSADVSVVENSTIAAGTEERVGDFPIILPGIGISSIGAGGGSIASVDGAAMLRVGPESAGADPGPACYGLGGTRPTLTDAFVACGYLGAERFAGGFSLDEEAARRALVTVGGPLGFDALKVSEAIVRVALASMYGELSAVFDRRGLDPRDFTLVAFGGAGPLVACLLAAETNIARVLVPPAPATLCALGAVHADVMTDLVSTLNEPLDRLDAAALAAAFAPVVARAKAWLEREAPATARTELRLSADMRYVGQAYELEVPVPSEWLEAGDLHALAAAFHDRHRRVFFHADPDAPAEIVDLRVRAVGELPRSPDPSPNGQRAKDVQSTGARRIGVAGARYEAPVYARESLARGATFIGPVLVEQDGSTTLVPEGWRVVVDERGNLVAEPGS